MNRFKLTKYVAGRGTKQCIGEILSGQVISGMSTTISPKSLFVFGQEGDLLATAPITADLTIYTEDLFDRKYSEKNPDIDFSTNAYDLKVKPTSAKIIGGEQFNDYTFFMTDETVDPTKKSTKTERDLPTSAWMKSEHQVVTYYPTSGQTNPYHSFSTTTTAQSYDYLYYANPTFITSTFFTKALYYNVADDQSTLTISSPGTLQLSGYQRQLKKTHIGCTYSFTEENNPTPLSSLNIAFDFKLKNTDIDLYYNAELEWGPAYRYIKVPNLSGYFYGGLTPFRFIIGDGVGEIMVNNGKLGYQNADGGFTVFPQLSSTTLLPDTWYSIEINNFNYTIDQPLSLSDNYTLKLSRGSTVLTSSATGQIFVNHEWPYNNYKNMSLTENRHDYVSFVDFRTMGDVYSVAPTNVVGILPKTNPYLNPTYTKYTSSTFAADYSPTNRIDIRNFSVATTTKSDQTVVTTTSGTIIDPTNPGLFDVNLIISKTPIYLGDYYPIVFGEISGDQIDVYVKDMSSNWVYEISHESPGLPFTYLFETPMDVGPKFTNTSNNIVFGELNGTSAEYAYSPAIVLSGYGTLYSPYADDDSDLNKVYYNPFILKNMYDYDWQTRIDQPRELLVGIRDYAKIGKTQDTIWLSYKYHTLSASIITDYELVERVKGLYKFRPIEGHKSNVYSIRINNSGLNETIADMSNPDTGALSGYTTSGIVIELKEIIKKSVHEAVKKIAPSHTQLWKIEYTGS